MGRSARNLACWLWMTLLLAAMGCHLLPVDARPGVSHALVQRMAAPLAPATAPGELTLPPGICLEAGFSEDEAVLTALWNNAAFQDLLVDLQLSRADLIQAGLLPNPEFVYFFNVPEKPYKYAFEVPLEALWLRPIRLAAARRELERTADRLVQAGLDLMRDVRQGHADVLLARDRLQVAKDAVAIRRQIATLAQKRLNAGEASPQEAATARIDALQTEQDLIRVQQDVELAEERLRNLLGISPCRAPLVLRRPESTPPIVTDVEQLTGEAIRTRPDAQAAEQAIAAAAERVRLAKLVWVRVLGIGDATSGRGTGHEFGPALRMTVPIFNWNQGNIARAEGELERTTRQRQTVTNQIIQDVHQAHTRFVQARAELDWLQTKVRPEVEAAIRRAERAYQEGDTTYIVVLETTRQLLDSRNREAQLHADFQRARADLERSVGRRLGTEVAPELPAAPPMLPVGD